MQGAYAARAPSVASAIATVVAEGDIMEHKLSVLARTNRSIRRLIGRLRHKADIQFMITVNLPHS
jgi:hypothetical protein